MHAVLVAAATLTAWPWAAQCLALCAVAGHAFLARPRRPPAFVLCADGSCAVPEWRVERGRLGPRTVIGPGWLRLHLENGARRRDIVLFVDQLESHEWRRLKALLGRLQRE